MPEREGSLAGVRVLAALNGLELFGQERENIEVYKTLRGLGAIVCVGVNALEDGGDVGRQLRDLGFATFPLPFSNQWSLEVAEAVPDEHRREGPIRRGMLPEVQEEDLRAATDAHPAGESARLQLPLARAGDVPGADGLPDGRLPTVRLALQSAHLAACDAPDVACRRHLGLRPARGDLRWRSGGSPFRDLQSRACKARTAGGARAGAGGDGGEGAEDRLRRGRRGAQGSPATRAGVCHPASAVPGSRPGHRRGVEVRRPVPGRDEQADRRGWACGLRRHARSPGRPDALLSERRRSRRALPVRGSRWATSSSRRSARGCRPSSSVRADCRSSFATAWMA